MPFLSRLNRFFLKQIRSVTRRLDRLVRRKENLVIDQLVLFVPASAMTQADAFRLTLEAANQTFPFLVEALQSIHGNELPQLAPVDSIFASAQDKVSADGLKSLLDGYGSDKATRHDYHRLYGPILAALPDACRILEIGLGTNHLDVASNMGRFGRPGASLRAFAEFKPAASVFGADIDRRILFSEPRIKTTFVDQTKPETFKLLDSEFGSDFDLIIDDGLHSPNANLATLAFAAPRLKLGGWFVIEDIREAALPLWQIVAFAIDKTEYQPFLLRTKQAFIFVLFRKLRQ
jgi:hypothetical protein